MYSQYFQLFALMAIGFGANKLKLFDKRAHQGLAAIVLSIAFPCMAFNNVSSLDMSGGALLHFVEVVLVTLLFTLGSVGLVRLFLRYRKKQDGESHDQANRILPATEACACMPNDGFIGFPVALLFFGSEGLFYMISINLIITVFLFSYADGRFIPESEMQGSAKWKHIKKAMTQPLIIGAVLGVFASIFHLQLPSVLTSLLSTVGGLASPIAMIYIGSILASTNLSLPRREIRPIVEGTLLKLVILPALSVLVALALLRSGLWTEVIAKTFVISVTMPTAALVLAFAENHGGNTRLSGWLVLVTTVISIGTIPLWLEIVARIF